MNAISDIRARLQVTQAALGDALHVTQGNISNYERGQSVPPDVARRLIVYAHQRGVLITYNDIYGPVDLLPAPAPGAVAHCRRKDDPPAPAGPCPERRQDDQPPRAP